MQPSMPAATSSLCLLFLLLLLRSARSDLAADQTECADKLVGLATCLPYVQGNAKTPTPDCCSGLKSVISNSPKCLCILVKDRDNPQLGISINATLALALPRICDVPANISECPKLLNLPPDSKDAQVFKQFGSPAAQGSAAAAAASGPGKGSSTATGSRSAQDSSGGRKNFGSWGIGRVGLAAVGLVLPIGVVLLNS